MSWDEDRRKAPSTSRANDPENTTKAPNPTGTGSAATARIAAGYGPSDTQSGRDRLRVLDWKDDP